MERNKEMRKEEAMGEGRREGYSFNVGAAQMTSLILVSTREEHVEKCTSSNCEWAVRQEKPATCKLECFKFFVRRMIEVNLIGRRKPKADMEAQLRVRMPQMRSDERA